MRIGCNTGSCRTAPEGGAATIRQLVQGGLPPVDAPCCAHCAGVELDPALPPASPRDLLAAGRGCPLSIIAYRAAKEAEKGRQVAVRDVTGRTPILLVDGKQIDPLEDYKVRACGCGGAA